MSLVHFAGVALPLPKPPVGFRWQLGGWMGSTMERPWPNLVPDPDRMVVLTEHEWMDVVAGLNNAGRERSIMRRESTALADRIARQAWGSDENSDPQTRGSVE